MGYSLHRLGEDVAGVVQPGREHELRHDLVARAEVDRLVVRVLALRAGTRLVC